MSERMRAMSHWFNSERKQFRSRAERRRLRRIIGQSAAIGTSRACPSRRSRRNALRRAQEQFQRRARFGVEARGPRQATNGAFDATANRRVGQRWGRDRRRGVTIAYSRDNPRSKSGIAGFPIAQTFRIPPMAFYPEGGPGDEPGPSLGRKCHGGLPRKAPDAGRTGQTLRSQLRRAAESDQWAGGGGTDIRGRRLVSHECCGT